MKGDSHSADSTTALEQPTPAGGRERREQLGAVIPAPAMARPWRPNILKPGRNCWRLEPAHRAAFLVDGEAYFSAFRAAVLKAERSLFILGWDINSSTRLMPGRTPPDGLPNELGLFLNAVLARKRKLRAYVLSWDFAMIYVWEREWLPVYRLGWRTHRRMHFRLDGQHPPGASHHQKVVVIDDKVAFSGGFDLTKARWDTPAHAPDDPRRVHPDGTPYQPFHDVQMVVDGPAARALGDLARARWRRATGHTLKATPETRGDPWPDTVSPDLKDIRVGISRTQPAFAGEAEVREVEALYCDAIASARHSIYIENQYFTSHRLADALSRRLAEPDGPDVAIVLPTRTSGWLEQATMDVLRARVLRRLLAADRHDRLRLYCPVQPELARSCVMVHAKILVVDDCLVRVGSANMSNRSMGFDTECDLAIEGEEGGPTARTITDFRNRLLAEHLDVAPGEVEHAITAAGSLIAGIEQLRGQGRTLDALNHEVSAELDRQVPDAAIIDPERPGDLQTLTDAFLPKDAQPHAGRRALRFGLALATLLLLAAAWKFSPLGEWLSLERVLAGAETLRELPLAPLVFVGVYVVGGLIVAPVTLLIVVTTLVFGPLEGFFYSLAGTLSSAMVLYGLGRWLGRDFVRRVSGSKLNRLSRRLAKRGVLAVTVIRAVPIAPFSVVNLVAGASHIHFRDYLIGTVLGMAPGILAITVFSDQILSSLRNPSPTGFAIAGAIAAAVLGIGVLARRWLGKRNPEP